MEILNLSPSAEKRKFMGKLVAVIVETRELVDLEMIIKSHMRMLPETTDLCIITSEANLHLSNLFPKAFFMWKSGFMSTTRYNMLLTLPWFWEYFMDYDRVLIFQHDSIILRPGIEEFMPYDYVGAPWTFQEHGGNGGLSLRNPKVMHHVCQTFPWDGTNEDVYFCNKMKEKNIGNVAPRSVCEKFSVESIFKLGTFGGHAMDKYLTKNQYHQIFTQYL